MKKLSKRCKALEKLIDKSKTYDLPEAVTLLKDVPHVKFDETVQASFKLDVDPKQSDQMVRGTILLPHGTGKTVRVAVICKGEAVNFAKGAGADFVGSNEIGRAHV